MENGKIQLENEHLRSEVIRLIKNKIEPLNYKYFVLKGDSTSLPKLHCSSDANRSCRRKKNKKKMKKKALVQVIDEDDDDYFMNLQKKVEKHIECKKMFIQEEETKDQNGEETKTKSTPLSKYLQLFEIKKEKQKKVQLEKEKKQDEPPQNLPSLKSTKLFRSSKEIELFAKKAAHLQDITDYLLTHRNKTSKQIQWKSNNRLKRHILNDIKEEYLNQNSSKIRLNINHRKMILK